MLSWPGPSSSVLPHVPPLLLVLNHRCCKVGADEARFDSPNTPMAFMCLSMSSRETCFVSKSAGFSEPATFVREKSPRLSLSCTHRSATCRCRIRPNPQRRHIPIAAVASVMMFTLKLMPKSLASYCNPRAIDAPRQIPPNSASPEERAMVGCVTDQCLMGWHPRSAMPPEVDRRVT